MQERSKTPWHNNNIIIHLNLQVYRLIWKFQWRMWNRPIALFWYTVHFICALSFDANIKLREPALRVCTICPRRCICVCVCVCVGEGARLVHKQNRGVVSIDPSQRGLRASCYRVAFPNRFWSMISEFRLMSCYVGFVFDYVIARALRFW